MAKKHFRDYTFSLEVLVSPVLDWIVVCILFELEDSVVDVFHRDSSKSIFAPQWGQKLDNTSVPVDLLIKASSKQTEQ